MSRLTSAKKQQITRTYEANKDSMMLRNLLALDRTILANERTVLAWVRTGLSIFIAGITFIKYINDTLFHIAGYGFAIFGIAVLGVGALRYNRLRHKLEKLHTIEEKEFDKTL